MRLSCTVFEILSLIFKSYRSHLPTPLSKQGQFVFRRLGLAMINMHTKFEVSTITCNEQK